MFLITKDEIKKILIDNDIKPSLPRIKIYEFLYNTDNHPTIDEIYNSLIDELITLSKTTVYNTLSLFVKNNLAIQILIEENEVRYDANVLDHGHFKCIICKKIYDFKYDISFTDFEELNGFKLEDYYTYIKGVCKNCMDKK